MRRSSAFAFLLGAALIVALASPIQAYDLTRPVFTSRTVGMGGACVALANDASAITCNPAGMSVGEKYIFAGNYLFNSKSADSMFAVSSINSSKENQTDAGLSYIQSQGEIDGTHRTIKSISLGSSKTVSNFMAVGAAGKYTWTGGVGVEDQHFFTSDIGVLVQPAEFLTLGAAMNNYLGPYSSWVTHKTATVGFALMIPDFASLGADTYRDFNIGANFLDVTHVGLEIRLPSRVEAQGGCVLEKPAQGSVSRRYAAHYSAGLMLNLERITVGAAAFFEPDGSDTFSATINVDIL